MLWKVITWFQLPVHFPLLAILLHYQEHNKILQAGPFTSATCECASSYSSQEQHTPGGAFLLPNLKIMLTN